MRSSYMGQIGHRARARHPPRSATTRKIGVGLISAMAAREVIIGTMAIIYNAAVPRN